MPSEPEDRFKVVPSEEKAWGYNVVDAVGDMDPEFFSNHKRAKRHCRDMNFSFSDPSPPDPPTVEDRLGDVEEAVADLIGQFVGKSSTLPEGLVSPEDLAKVTKEGRFMNRQIGDLGRDDLLRIVAFYYMKDQKRLRDVP